MDRVFVYRIKNEVQGDCISCISVWDKARPSLLFVVDRNELRYALADANGTNPRALLGGVI